MGLALEHAVGQKLMLSFEGAEPPAGIVALLRRRPVGGFTLFRATNVESPAQVRRLTAALQQAAAQGRQPSILIAADQEGGQLNAIGGTTPFPGNMALGAAGSAELARRAGHALGNELAAMGINVNFAPVCDVNSNPGNPVVGIRSFGEDPLAVAELSAAMVAGLQSAGVAATAKHFPGHGDTGHDPHYGLPVVHHDRQRLEEVEFPPFAAAIRAGVRLIMTAHLALPALNEGVPLPSTLSPAVLEGVLRGDMGFGGVIISDALNMAAIRQGDGLIVDAIAAVAAGVDLLLLVGSLRRQKRIHAALHQAVERGLLSRARIVASAERVLALKGWLGSVPQPPLDRVGCPGHRDLAYEIAARSITLVRDRAGLLPLRLAAGARLAAVVPQPADLTPADTSSYESCQMAAALRRRHRAVDEFVLPPASSQAEVEALRQKLSGYDLVVVGTINAFAQAGQAGLVRALLAAGIPTVAVALRLPYDLQAYPDAPTFLCTYNLLEPSMEALAGVLWGEIPAVGRLPVSIPGLYPIGAGLASSAR